MPRAESDQYQTLVYDLAQANGMRFQVRNVLTPADLAFEGSGFESGCRSPAGSGSGRTGSRCTGGAVPGGRDPRSGRGFQPVQYRCRSGLPVDQQAFLAGYIAGMVAPEWRVGILSQKDTPGGDAAVTAFANGYHFYCGDCFNPNFPQPFSHGLYPIIVRIPTDAPESDYTGYADLLIQNFVKVAYLYPEIATPAPAFLPGSERRAAHQPDPAW